MKGSFLNYMSNYAHLTNKSVSYLIQFILFSMQKFPYSSIRPIHNLKLALCMKQIV